MSWHTDWYLIEADRWRDKWLIAYMDDASRFIVGYGIFDQATAENAISVLDDYINRYGKPLELLTDHGRQFYFRHCERQRQRQRMVVIFIIFIISLFQVTRAET